MLNVGVAEGLKDAGFDETSSLSKGGIFEWTRDKKVEKPLDWYLAGRARRSLFQEIFAYMSRVAKIDSSETVCDNVRSTDGYILCLSS